MRLGTQELINKVFFCGILLSWIFQKYFRCVFIFMHYKCAALQLPKVNGQNLINRIELIMLKIIFSPDFDHFSGRYSKIKLLMHYRDD